MDRQFKPLQADLAAMGIELNVVSNNEHVPKIEQHIRTTKKEFKPSGAHFCLPIYHSD